VSECDLFRFDLKETTEEETDASEALLRLPSPGIYFWPYPVSEAVRYGEIQRDTGYSWIQLDTYGYRWMQRDTAGYSGSAARWLDIDRYRDAAGCQGYGEIQAGYRWNTGGISQKIHARGGLQVATYPGVG